MSKVGLCIAACILVGVIAACNMMGPGELTYLYDVYPDTEDPPLLAYYGPDPDQVGIDSIGAYGDWEGGGNAFKPGEEPATEIEIRSIGSSPVPLKAPCDGVLVYVNREGQDGDVSIRYGRRYVVKYLHVAGIPTNLRAGMKVRQGDLVGYTASMGPDTQFWELELDKLYPKSAAFGGRPLLVSVYPLPYFSQEAQATLERVRRAVQNQHGSDPDWIAPTSDPSAGWLASVPSHEMWADSHKAGYDGPFVGLEEYLKHYGLEGILSPAGQ